jgi:hypothetical protein
MYVFGVGRLLGEILHMALTEQSAPDPEVKCCDVLL